MSRAESSQTTVLEAGELCKALQRIRGSTDPDSSEALQCLERFEIVKCSVKDLVPLTKLEAKFVIKSVIYPYAVLTMQHQCKNLAYAMADFVQWVRCKIDTKESKRRDMILEMIRTVSGGAVCCATASNVDIHNPVSCHTVCWLGCRSSRRRKYTTRKDSSYKKKKPAGV